MNLHCRLATLTLLALLASWAAGCGGGGSAPGGTPLDSSLAGRISVRDANSMALITTVPTGAGCDDAAYDGTNDRVFVANRGAGTVSVFDAATLTEVAGSPVQVGVNPVAIAYDHLRNRVYVANSQSDSLTVLDATSLVEVPGSPVAVGGFPTGVDFGP